MSEKRPAPGRAFVISAPSGAGKTTLLKRIVAALPDVEFSVSFTTRKPRQEEREGVDYHFIDREEFERHRARGDFLEWAEVGGDLYGTSADAVRRTTTLGKDILLDLDTQGAASVRQRMPEATLIFIMPPNADALRERLERRGTESRDVIERRLRLGREEMGKASLYDHVVVNDDLEMAYRQLRSLIRGARGSGDPRGKGGEAG